MTFWPEADVQAFFAAFEQLWPKKLSAEPGSQAVRAWKDVAQRYHREVALEALREIYSSQERSQAPTLAGFASVARGIAEFIENESRRRREVERRDEPTFTGKEIAADDAFWKERFALAASPESLEFLKSLRKLCSAGAGLRAISGFLGDYLVMQNGKTFSQTSPQETP